MRFAISSDNVCLPSGVEPAVIVINDGRIESIFSTAEFPGDVACEHLGESIIAPGLIDSHVHINEPGRTEWEGFETATAAAAAGGVTTLIDMPLNSSPVTTTPSALKIKRDAAAGKCRVDVGFYGGLIPDNSDSIAKLLFDGVFGIKAFLCDSGLQEFPKTGAQQIREILPLLRDLNVPLLVHAELVTERMAPTVTDDQLYFQYMESRPDQWETDAIQLLIDLCEEYQTPIHVVHVATAHAVELMQSAKRSGLPISFETCPHYLFFEAEQIPDGDTRFKCAPPIRKSANRNKLWGAVKSGLFDTIGSDHSPCPPDLKMMAAKSFTRAWGGIAGLQFSLPVMSTLAQSNGLSTFELSKLMSTNPARIFSLEKRKGRLAEGLDADIVVWDPHQEFVVSNENNFHRHSVTPYEGITLRGLVERTYCRGKLVFQNGHLVGDPMGALLERQACAI